MDTEPKAPIKEFRAGTVSAAIWKKEVAAEGRTVTQYSVRIQKSFRDKMTDEWRTSDYFFPNDLPRLGLVAGRAFEFITLHESEDV